MTNYDEQPIEIRDCRAPFTWVDSDVLRCIGSTIGGKGIAVYMIIASYANNRTQRSFPSISTIAKLTRFSKLTVLRLVSQLQAAHFLHVEKRSGRSNLYTLLDKPASTRTRETPQPQTGIATKPPPVSLRNQTGITTKPELYLIEKKVNHSEPSSSSLGKKEEGSPLAPTISEEMLAELQKARPDWQAMPPYERAKKRAGNYDKSYQ